MMNIPLSLAKLGSMVPRGKQGTQKPLCKRASKTASLGSAQIKEIEEATRIQIILARELAKDVRITEEQVRSTCVDSGR